MWRPRPRPFASAPAPTRGLLVPLVLLGCGLEAGERYGAGSAAPAILRLQIDDAPRDIEEFDPARARTDVAASLAKDLFAGLVELDAAGAPGPAIALAWTREGDRLRFELDPAARFTNAEPITASAVVWSWRRALRPSTGTADLEPLGVIGNGRALARRALLRVGMDGAWTGPAPFPAFRHGPSPVQRAALPAGAAVAVLDTNLRVPCCGAPVPLAQDVDGAGAALAVGALRDEEIGVIVGLHEVTTGTLLQLRTPSGLVGWAASDRLTSHLPEPGLAPVVDRGGGVALRAGPDEDAPIRDTLGDDEVVEIMERDAAFVGVIALRSGVSGFISPEELDTTVRDRRWLRVRLLESAQAGSEGWVPEDALVFDASLLDARVIDDHTLELGLAAGVETAAVLRALAAAPLRPVPPRVVAAHGHAWTAPGTIATSGRFQLAEVNARTTGDLAVVLVPAGPESGSGPARIELFDFARATTALHLYRSGFLDGVIDGGLPTELIPGLARAMDFVPGPRGGGLIAPEWQGLPATGLRLRDVRRAPRARAGREAP